MNDVQQSAAIGQITQQIDTFSVELLGYFLRRLDSADDAAEALSDVFVIAWKKRRTAPREAENARAWLYAIAHNVLRNQHRSTGRARHLARRLQLELAAQDRVAVDFTTSVAEADRVRQALAALDPEIAELIRLVHWERLTIAEAATVLDIPASTARSRYQSAKTKLRTALGSRAEQRG